MGSALFSILDDCFPRAAAYRGAKRREVVRENGAEFHSPSFRERHLQCVWSDPRLRPAHLETSRGEPVAVEHPGTWNTEAGPDFLDAVLLVGKERRRIRGDLEIHIHPSAWKQHGHAGDPRHANTRFHVVYFQGPEIPGLLQIPLQAPLAANPGFSFEDIDISAYPYAIPTGDFPLREMDPDEKIQWLESAGEERLRLKAERMALVLREKGEEQLLWEELLAALGYKNNKAPFRRLATLLPLPRLREIAAMPKEAYALLLGLSGLLPANPSSTWDAEARRFFRFVWDFWWKQSEELKEKALERADWNLSGLRPLNHPLRRLMAAAHYAFQTLEIAADRERLTRFPPGFWTTHLSWKTPCKPSALVGKPRANAMVANILVPFLAATGRECPELQKLPPEPLNAIARQTAYALFGPDHTPKTYRSALARQGLIQVFNDYIATRRLADLASA